jgi:hypothetical protein
MSTMAVGLFPNTDLPPECNLTILSHLGAQDLGRCCQVSKEWRKLASDDNLWKQLFPGLTLPEGVSRKELFNDSHFVNSRAKIKQHIAEFVDNLPLNEAATIKCYFLKNPGCTITVKVGKVNGNAKTEPSRIEKIIFKGTLKGTQLCTSRYSKQLSYSPSPAIPFIRPTHISSPIYCRTVLPLEAKSTQNEICKILVFRVRELADRAQTQFRNDILYYGTATAVAAVAVAVNIYSE